jgi:hypothetical protein
MIEHQLAANMAQAVFTAFPLCMKILTPAAAARGLPVIAIQCFPCSTGFRGPPGLGGKNQNLEKKKSTNKACFILERFR